LQNFIEKYDANLHKFYGGYFYRQAFDLYHWIGSCYVLFADKENFPRDEKGKSRFNLSCICKQMKVELTNAHDADADIFASMSCMIKMWNILKKKLVS